MATARGRTSSVVLRRVTRFDWLSQCVAMATEPGRPISVEPRCAARFDWQEERNNGRGRDPDEYSVIRVHHS